ncbi:RagB/SusD family nutrient uptake outer membrane protein [Rhodocytophaga aerolata]|uniref:RagB/SusD family nutrient uptake outer membrane protein n=1 Tax=Rhodocytophaga aerolata TaxID=455078 RepID=A0ABT8QYR9_9BACT|nr:RagB/SusD family nutrient uptake outer membrane protein [Rhodocytophaga aerolata]MDO1444996.1 RagB/SusD family nutrient uptake outer membrane protein [Rhodocytophaga aerolata]
MKNTTKIKSITLGIVIAMFSVTGCNDDFMNTKPLVEVPSEDVWKDEGLAEAFITDFYYGLNQGGFDEQMLASLTDEAIFTHPGRNINTITEARSNPANPGWINAPLTWGARDFGLYGRIRANNLALENLQNPQFNNPALVERLLGEAYFMRAYNYHQLLRYYGAVPLVDRSYGLGESDYSMPRNTFEECVNFIVKDAEEAARLLDGKTMAQGRASKAAALALKSRVLLYASRDLHDAPTAQAKSSTLAGYSNPEYFGYVSGSRTERWQKAKEAAKTVIDLPGYGFRLDLGAPVTPQEGKDNYMNVSLSRNGGERDMIFGRYFSSQKNENGGRQGLFNGPNGYNNWAGNAPIENLVSDYEMMDGTSFDWSNPAHASAPYTNRDPRFYASILYDGAPWKPRPAGVAPKEPFNEIQTGHYEVGSANGAKSTHFGLDTRQSSVEDWNGTRTGYYIRKFTDPNPAIVDQNTWQQVPWPFFRYTEAVLNYVEACIELGEDAEAQMWLNKVRFRVGMPAVIETGDALRQRYRNERRVELAYEEHRYHDARQWMIADQTLGQKAQIIEIRGTLKPGKSVSIYRYNPENYTYSYSVQNIAEGIENRMWLDKMYFLPISRDEMNRNDKLVQNPGY